MPEVFSKLFFRLSITSLIGVYCLALAPSALARNGNGNGNGNSSQSSTTTTTTNGNGNGNSSQSSTTATTTNGNGNGNSSQSSTTTTTTNGNGNGNSSQSSTTTTSSSTTCSLTDVFIGNTQATACKGPFEGNDTGAKGTLLDDLNKGLFNLGAEATWTLAGKSDGSDNLGFEAQNGLSSGTWNLGTAFGNSSATFVISLKTSTNYSAYLFKDIDFSKTGLQGIFNTIGVALNGSGTQGKGLSHASIFVASYVKPPEPPKARVPEASTTIGLGIVFGSMLISRRRKSNQSA